MTTLGDTPSANRIHIGFFGKTNSGKSSLINALVAQNVSIVSEVAGTTTDPVYKAMEIYPLGPCMLMDTAGFDDVSLLGGERIEKTKLAAEKADIAVVVCADDRLEEEIKWCRYFKEKETPVMLVINKADLLKNVDDIAEQVQNKINLKPIIVSAKEGIGIEQIREHFVRLLPKNWGGRLITGNLVHEKDLVLLVMPQDIQAPKGRLILPQVQTIRELLDKQCMVVSVTTNQLTTALSTLIQPPKLIITDSQAFSYVYANKPKESMLTSFSVLFAAYKGDLPYYIEAAKALESLTQNSRVLIAECCSHAPLKEDIGREKIPQMLRRRFGNLTVEVVSGNEYPRDLSGYDLIIQCGACMFHRKYVMSRINRAKEQSVPMTNYGVAIAHLTGILPQIVFPDENE